MEFFHAQDKLKSLVADAVQQAMRKGADAADANASEGVNMEVESRGGKMDGMNISREQGLSVTVYVNGGEGATAVGEFSAAAIDTAVDKALSIARASAADKFAGLADKDTMAQEFPDLSLDHPCTISADEAFARARECEESAWAAHPSINRQKSEASFSTAAGQAAFANSHGFCAAEAATAYSLSCAAIAEKDGQMERDGWGETRRQESRMPTAADIGARAGEYAARRLGGKKIQSRRANVLFMAPVSHSLIYHIVGAASGSALYHKTSWLLDKMDQLICAPHIHITECPHLLGEMRSAVYDDEGAATKQRNIVENGKWCGRFLSSYSARRLGLQSTANAGGAHNLEVSGDVRPMDEMMKMLGDGLLVTDLMGQGVNAVTGDYSRGAAGFWVENGEIVHPVSEATIAGNLLQMLPSIAALGDDTMRRGLVKCGSILIPDMMLGGG
ncbi:MAG: TldD/PmbA family protein [Gammaproteobacteria bacterium WSBS_2016_MAG_OTU1]